MGFKGAVCNCPIAYTNNICLYFGNMLNSHTCFSENNATVFSTLICDYCVGISVFVLVSVIPPTANLPNLTIWVAT